MAPPLLLRCEQLEELIASDDFHENAEELVPRLEKLLVATLTEASAAAEVR